MEIELPEVLLEFVWSEDFLLFHLIAPSADINYYLRLKTPPSYQLYQESDNVRNFKLHFTFSQLKLRNCLNFCNFDQKGNPFYSQILETREESISG